MAMRWGLGPVFTYEWLTMARRWQVYAARSAFVAVLLAGLAGVWASEVADQPPLSIRAQAQVGRSFFQTIVGIQFALVLLAAPAASAGSICLDKARGTLTHVFVTDLSDAEIVLGKLAARLAPVLGLMACTLPVLALGTLLGGIDPVQLTGAFLVTLGVAVLGCALALTLSVWGTKTHEVLLATYAIVLVWLLLAPIWATLRGAFVGTWTTAPVWLIGTNPAAMVLAQSPRPGILDLAHQAALGAGCVLVAAALTALAIAKVRVVAARQAGRAPRARRDRHGTGAPARGARLLPGPTLDGNPVLWREWHRRRPSRWTRTVWVLYALLTIGFSLIAIEGGLSGNRMTRDTGSVINGFQISVGLLLLSVSAATSLAEERVRGSLDVLLATPLSTPAIVWGKWWGSFRAVPPLAILPGLVAAALGSTTGRWPAAVLVVAAVLAYGAALTSLGLALATWVPRLGRAVSGCVSAYVLVAVGIIPLAFVFLRNDEVNGPGLAMASPFFGVGYFSAYIAETGGPSQNWPACVGWSLFWTVAYAVVAAVLLGATLATFDHCLGRTVEGSGPVTPVWMDKKGALRWEEL
jgi:ABC-type transport system involved in multi-copper enzyme maturation permease subunit